jgi:hypothetical protein
LLPSGRNARKAAEHELVVRSQRAEQVAPQSAHPHQPHPPAFLIDPPARATPTPLPPVPPPPSAWGTPTPVPPAPPPSGGRRPLVTVFLVIAGMLGFFGAKFAFQTIVDSIGTKVSGADKLAVIGEPTVYDGPTFSVRLRGPVAVQHVSEEGVELTIYGSDQGDVYMGLAVSDQPQDSG